MRIKLLSLFAFLWLASQVSGLNKARDCKCRLPTHSKIVNGKFASVVYPWSVTFFEKEPKSDSLRKLLPVDQKVNKQKCDGIILNENLILTAGTCAPYLSERYEVKMGSNDLAALFDTANGYEIAEVIRHPNLTYHGMTPANDLALVRLVRGIEFSEKVQPACFDVADAHEYAGQLNTIGHGHQSVVRAKLGSESGKLKRGRFLKEIDLVDRTPELLYKDVCWYDAYICVHGKADGDSICDGDQGNPLMLTRDGKVSVVGVASFPSLKFLDANQIVGCLGNETSIFTRTSKFWNWVRTHVQDDYCDSSSA